MLNHKSLELIGIDGQLISIYANEKPLTFEQVFTEWRGEKSFRVFFSELLVALPYTAIRWETPQLTLSSAARPFECVVVNSPELET
ncbi:MAG: DUF6940 family protein, partial [bacterium]